MTTAFLCLRGSKLAVPKQLNTKYSAIIFEDTDTLIKARVSATGTFRLSGLNIGFVINTVSISDTASLLPTLAQQNSIEIHNLSETATIYVGPANTVTADRVVGSTSGKEIPPDSYWSVDVTDAIAIWAICPAGESALAKVMGVA